RHQQVSPPRNGPAERRPIPLLSSVNTNQDLAGALRPVLSTGSGPRCLHRRPVQIATAGWTIDVPSMRRKLISLEMSRRWKRPYVTRAGSKPTPCSHRGEGPNARSVHPNRRGQFAAVGIENRVEHLVEILPVALERLAVHADGIEREVEHQFGPILEHAGAPERRPDREAPFSRAEARLELANLEDA